MRVVVATIVHDPEDARIFHRQIGALLAAGHQVVYLAPVGTGRDLAQPGLRIREIGRAHGRHRIAALRSARRALIEESPDADLTIVHDPELTVLARSICGPKVWDVHEDLVAQVSDKHWIPTALRGPARLLGRRLERRARGRFETMLAEPSYRERHGDRPVVRNTPEIPDDVVPPGDDRIVYVGRVSHGRGIDTMLAATRLIDGVRLDLYGPVDRDVEPLIRHAPASVTSHGFVTNPEALRRIEGAMAGLAILADQPNYRHSMPTKIFEYMARGVPVITTPNPVARRIVEDAGAGIVVPFNDPSAVAEAIDRLADVEFRRRCAANGRRVAQASYNWSTDSRVMLDFLESVVHDARSSSCHG